jgi:UDP-sugar transporter A1/2/3
MDGVRVRTAIDAEEGHNNKPPYHETNSKHAISVEENSHDPVHVVRSHHLSNTSYFGLAIVSVLSLQMTCFTLLRRYSQAVLTENYSPSSVLCAAEGLKLIFSTLMIFQGSKKIDMSIPQWLWTLITTTHPLLIPAACYLIMNRLSFFALKRVDPATFTLIFQLKLLTTACFSMLMLGRSYKAFQLRALLLLIIGVIQITAATHPETSVTRDAELAVDVWNFRLGVIAAVCEVTLSGFSTVYMEKMFKSAPKLTIWDRNFQLALCSIPVYIIIHKLETSSSFFTGWSLIAVALTLISALGGLLVAICLKYADAVLKNFASTGSIMLTTALGWLLLEGPMNSFVLAACATVVVGVFDYTDQSR